MWIFQHFWIFCIIHIAFLYVFNFFSYVKCFTGFMGFWRSWVLQLADAILLKHDDTSSFEYLHFYIIKQHLWTWLKDSKCNFIFSIMFKKNVRSEQAWRRHLHINKTLIRHISASIRVQLILQHLFSILTNYVSQIWNYLASELF